MGQHTKDVKKEVRLPRKSTRKTDGAPSIDGGYYSGGVLGGLSTQVGPQLNIMPIPRHTVWRFCWGYSGSADYYLSQIPITGKICRVSEK